MVSVLMECVLHATSIRYCLSPLESAVVIVHVD